jgi:hypothetical protein
VKKSNAFVGANDFTALVNYKAVSACTGVIEAAVTMAADNLHPPISSSTKCVVW